VKVGSNSAREDVRTNTPETASGVLSLCAGAANQFCL
jgi:hypothetical protein